MVISSSISPYLYLPPPVRCVHFGVVAFPGHIAVKAILRGKNELLGIGWLPLQPSCMVDNVFTAIFDWAVVILVPSHMLKSLLFPLPKSLIICHGSHKPLDTIPIFEAWDMQMGVFFLPHVYIVLLHALLVDPTLDIFSLFTCRKQVVGIVL
jgi:hypothetical protein